MFQEEEYDFVSLKWGSFTRTWKAFQRRNFGPDTLKEFAFFVETHPDLFRKVTRRRAKFFLEIVLR